MKNILIQITMPAIYQVQNQPGIDDRHLVSKKKKKEEQKKENRKIIPKINPFN